MDLYIDSLYKFSVYHIMKGATHSDARVTMFIDYNNNKLYDLPQERVFSGTADASNFYLVGQFLTPPTPALSVPTGMRVILNNDVAPNPSSDNGVGTYVSGETEDYLVRFNLKLFNPNSLSDINVIDHIQLYPNPTNGLTYIGFETKENINIELSVHSLTGQELQRSNYLNINGAFSTEINLSNYASGTYLLKIKTENGHYIRKIAVH